MRQRLPESVILEFIERINAGDAAGIASLTAPVYTFTDTEGDVYVVEGPEAVRQSWNEYLLAYPNYKIFVQRVLRSGNGVAIVGQTSGSHLPSEIEREELVLWIAELEDGLVSDWRIYSTLMCDAATSRAT